MREFPSSGRTAMIVADGHREAGLGHLSRSTAIAVALRCRGVAVSCLAYGRDEPFARDGVQWLPLELMGGPRPSDVVVIDSYRLTADEIRTLAGSAPFVLLHDFGRSVHGAALVVSAAPVEARHEGDRLSGLQYVALRPMFWGMPKRELRDRVGSVLVTTGGGDLAAVGGEIAAQVVEAVPTARVMLVRALGSTVGAPVGVNLLDSPTSLLHPMLEADVVVTAAGQTMLEAAAAGTPCVAMALVENQVQQAQALAGIGAVRLVDPVGRDGDSAAAAVKDLAQDAAARAELSERSQRAVDGYGALRIAYRIGGLIGPET